MTPEQFCYWLQGFAEPRLGAGAPTTQQWAIITEHLNTVFNKVTPDHHPKVNLHFPPGMRGGPDSGLRADI